MKLKSLIIKNFRGLKGEENVIDFDESNIIFLIGKNNYGKSTFLHAYNFFVDSKKKSMKEDFYNKSVENHIEITGVFISEDGDSEDQLLKKLDPEWIDNWVDENNLIQIKKIWTNIGEEGVKQTYNPRSRKFEDGGFGGFDTLLTRYAPTAIQINAVTSAEELEKKINDIIAKEHIKKLETDYSEKYMEIINGLEELKNQISSSDDISKINTKMTSFFENVFPDLALKIYSMPDAGIDISKTLKSTHGISVEDKFTADMIYDLKKNGHGIIRQAFFSFLSTIEADLDETRKEYLILFEEPELYLHPEAIFSLREQLYKLSENSPFQILCATHSSLMIDTSKTHSSLVRLSKDENKNTKVFQVNFNLYDGEEKNFLQMINRFNPHICECFFADEVVLVEGDTEAVIYRYLISEYYSNEKEVFILNTGSKANMVFYQKILTHFGIKHVIVHDIDSPTYVTKDEEEKTNAMWTFNTSIWNQIVLSNQLHANISRRFTHFLNFEIAHDYKENKKKGKPLSAFEFAQTLTKEPSIPCFEFLDDLFNEGVINHNEEYIELKMADFQSSIN